MRECTKREIKDKALYIFYIILFLFVPLLIAALITPVKPVWIACLAFVVAVIGLFYGFYLGVYKYDRTKLEITWEEAEDEIDKWVWRGWLNEHALQKIKENKNNYINEWLIRINKNKISRRIAERAEMIGFFLCVLSFGAILVICVF